MHSISLCFDGISLYLSQGVDVPSQPQPSSSAQAARTHGNLVVEIVEAKDLPKQVSQ